MTAPISTGYLTPFEERIRSVAVTLTGLHGLPVSEGESVPDWDYSPTSIRPGQPTSTSPVCYRTAVCLPPPP